MSLIGSLEVSAFEFFIKALLIRKRKFTKLVQANKTCQVVSQQWKGPVNFDQKIIKFDTKDQIQTFPHSN